MLECLGLLVVIPDPPPRPNDAAPESAERRLYSDDEASLFVLNPDDRILPLYGNIIFRRFEHLQALPTYHKELFSIAGKYGGPVSMLAAAKSPSSRLPRQSRGAICPRH